MGKWELLPTVLKANGECQVKLEEESDDSIWEGLQQGKGGVKIWLLVQTERSLSETFNKMQNFRRVGFHSLLYVNLETPRKAPHQLLAAAEDHTTIWEIHRLRTRQSFFMCWIQSYLLSAGLYFGWQCIELSNSAGTVGREKLPFDLETHSFSCFGTTHSIPVGFRRCIFVESWVSDSLSDAVMKQSFTCHIQNRNFLKNYACSTPTLKLNSAS